jgi:pimeloyl-ACP methyl ester carboxylesterase
LHARRTTDYDGAITPYASHATMEHVMPSAAALPPELRAWRDRGEHIDAFGHEVFVVDEGTGDPLLVLHGYPSSSYDFVDVWPKWTARHRVVAHDHLGFGLSDKPADYSYSLVEQTDAALAVWRAAGIESGHLLAHDYGTSVATELLARRERGMLDFELRSVTLCNGSMHVEMAEMSVLQRLLSVEGVGDLLARLTTFPVFRAQIRRILGEGGRVTDRQIELMWAGIEYHSGRARIPRIARYSRERRLFWHRWIGALRRLDIPCHVLWGRQDAVAVAAMAETLAAEIPGARLSWLDDLGHYPMIEDPARWLEAVLDFLEEH